MNIVVSVNFVKTQDILRYGQPEVIKIFYNEYRQKLINKFSEELLAYSPIKDMELPEESNILGGETTQLKLEAVIMTMEDFKKVSTVMYAMLYCPENQLYTVMTELVDFMLHGKGSLEYDWMPKIINYKTK